LLLESRPLLESDVYASITEDVIASYWRDYADHKNNFIPAFLANDILGLWRTFCVNYEARTERVPDEAKAKGKLKNYKLKHSRLLTCYSGLLYLLAIYGRQGSVHPPEAMEMISLSPTERLEWVLAQPHLTNAHRRVQSLLAQYETFLETTNLSEAGLINKFMDKATSADYMSAAYKFGDLMFEVLGAIGNENRFHRLLVV
jgi:hypothetical protein